MTEERYHDKIELRKEFVKARKSGKIKPEVNAEKQDRHYPDTSRYKEGKSRFTADRAEVEAYIEDRLGKVPIKQGRGGTIREIVVFNEPIGEYKEGDEWRETNVVEVHHSKTGRHSVPSKPKWDK